MKFALPRLTTLLIIVAVAGVAIAAVVAAVISGGSDSPTEAAATAAATADQTESSPAGAVDPEISRLEMRDDLVTDLARAKVVGTLAIARGNDCGVYILSLPYLQANKRTDVETCSFPVASDTRLSTRSDTREPNGVLVARCRNGRLTVFDRIDTAAPPPGEQIARRYSFDGCAPDWRPDGQLTFVHDGEVVELSPTCLGSDGCAEVILTRSALAARLRAARPSLAFESAAIRQIAWTDQRRFFATIRLQTGDGVRRDVVGLVDETGAVTLAPPTSSDLSLLRISPQRTFVAVRAPADQALWVLRTRGDEIEVERFPPWAPPAPTDIKGIAWSPDERWTAVSSRTWIYLFETGKAENGYIGLPIAVSDVLWS